MLDDVRSRVHEAEEFSASSIRHVASPDSSTISDEDRDLNDSQRSIQTAPCLFGGCPSPSKLASSSSHPRGLNVVSRENETLVNEIVHGQHGIADKFVTDDHQDGLKVCECFFCLEDIPLFTFFVLSFFFLIRLTSHIM